MASPVRDTLRALRSAPERLAHAARRRAAMAAALAATPADTLVILCHGNVCRSPFAAACVALHPDAHRADLGVVSAGFIGPGRPVPPEGIAAAARCGLDLRHHRSQVVSSVRLGDRALVLVMNVRQQRTIELEHPRLKGRVLILGDFDPAPIATREIADPWGGGPAAFDASYARIRRCVEALPLAALGGRAIERDGPGNAGTISEPR